MITGEHFQLKTSEQRTQAVTRNGDEPVCNRWIAKNRRDQRRDAQIYNSGLDLDYVEAPGEEI